MKKIEKIKKIERAKEILHFNTVKEINEILKNEFGSGLSNTEFANLHKNLVTNELKVLIKQMYDFFIKIKNELKNVKLNTEDIEMFKKVEEVLL